MTRLINEDVEAKRAAILRGWMADQPERVRSVAESALAVYPWSSFFRRALAAALDVLEEHERALEVMLEAVFLEPEEPVMWQTLAVMLENRDHEFEYAFARAMQIRLENRYRWDGPGEDAPAPG
jgi:predicted Zn-dependent protease